MRASACCSWAVCRPSEQNLDQTHIGFLFEQVGGKAVAQCVRRHSLLDRRPVGSSMNGAIELPRRQRQQRITARERGTVRKGCEWLVFGIWRRPYHGGYHGFGPAPRTHGRGPILPPPEAAAGRQKSGPSAGWGLPRGRRPAPFHGDAHGASGDDLDKSYADNCIRKIASCSAAITNRNASQASLSSCSAIAIRSSASASLSVKRTSSNSNRIA